MSMVKVRDVPDLETLKKDPAWPELQVVESAAVLTWQASSPHKVVSEMVKKLGMVAACA